MTQCSRAVRLPGGLVMPSCVYGVYQIRDAGQCQKTVEDALEAGYRAVDTAASYGNEAAVGAALRASGLPREDVFVTTKIWVDSASESGARRSVERSLELLGTDRIDLCLLHQPFGDVYGAWRAMEAMKREGLLRALGVSNFAPDRLTDFVLHQETAPEVNQVEISPLHQQPEALAVMDKLGVVPEAWAPLAEGRGGLFENPVLAAAAAKHGRSVAQIALRYVLELSAVVVAKTVRPERMRENLAVHEFELDDEDRAAIRALDTGRSQFFSHRDPEIVRWMCERTIEH